MEADFEYQACYGEKATGQRQAKSTTKQKRVLQTTINKQKAIHKLYAHTHKPYTKS